MRFIRAFATSLCVVLLAACASTVVRFSPSTPPALCDHSAAALVLWAPQWRPDQKDVTAREAAALSGLNRFFADSGCYARSEIRRVESDDLSAAVSGQPGSSGQFNVVVTIAVRELGPVIKLLSSASLIEGGTEVVLQITSRQLQPPNKLHDFTVHWHNGGPGVVKGVGSLADDMSAALRAGLQP